MGAQQLLLTATREDLVREFDVNVFGTTLMTQAAVIHGKIPSGGRIINVGSIASKLLPTPQGIYNASKCAQDATTTQWAAEVRHPPLPSLPARRRLPSPSIILDSLLYSPFLLTTVTRKRIARQDARHHRQHDRAGPRLHGRGVDCVEQT